MGRKVKSIVLLIFILVLIYFQHSPVIYAEGPESVKKEDNENEGGKDEGGEDESGDVKEPVKEYRMEVSESDGKNGYYVSIPRVKIEHVSKKGTTVYCLKKDETVLAEGRLSEEGSLALLGEGQFSEGRHVLTVYMEDEEGKRLEEYNQVREFLVDTIAPVFQMEVPRGFHAWYQNETYLYVSAGDGESGSGIDVISCYCGDKFIDAVRGTEGTFLINQASQNGKGAEITVVAADKAGHQTADTRKVFIDSLAPVIEIEGVTDYMITSREVLVSCKIYENNILGNYQVLVEQEDTEGKTTAYNGPAWKDEEGAKKAELVLKKDGLYRMKVTAEDLAGFSETKEVQVIIDSHNPVIRYVDELEGKYMKKFRWNYQKDEFIWDFTTYAHQIQLDGELYPAGEEVEEEGRHILHVQAIDSAGNKAEAKAGFVVDHTPPEILFLDIEESGVYEEERTFRIVPESPEDEIKEIRINGVQQSISKEKDEYLFTVKEKKAYEVAVKACDKAGNEAAASIMFEIVPKETVFEKALRPVKKMFVNEEKEERETGKGNVKSKEENKIPVVPVSAALCSICAAGGIGLKRRHH